MNYEMKELGKVAKAGFGIVLIGAASISLWSMMTLFITAYGMPFWAGVVGALTFDGAMIAMAYVTSQYARSPYSPLAPKLITYFLAGVSMFLNGQHALMLGLGWPAAIGFAAPSFIAMLIFDSFLKYTNRKALIEVGRFAMPLPVVGWLSWALYPKDAFASLRKTVGVRMRTAVARFENQQNATVTANAIANHTVKPVAKLEKVVADDVNAIENYANENAKPEIHNATNANAMKAIDANREVRTANVANLNANASVNAIVAKGYEEGLRTVDELVPFVNEIKPGTEKVKVSKALSYTKKKYNLEGTGQYL